MSPSVAPDWDAAAIEAVLALCSQVPAAAIEQLRSYADLLFRWSASISLVSAADRPFLAARHLAPCLAMTPVVASLPHDTILDFGSGGGLPGIPLKIMLPDSRLILVESRRKRANFLRQVARSLELTTLDVIHDRLEQWSIDAAAEGAGRVDLVVARAVDDPAKVVLATSPVLHSGGHVMVTLGPDWNPAHAVPGMVLREVVWAGGRLRLGIIGGAVDPQHLSTGKATQSVDK